MKQAMTIDTLWASLGASLGVQTDKGYRSYDTEADALADFAFKGKKYIGFSPDIEWCDKTEVGGRNV